MESTDIGSGTAIWAYAHILSGATIGAKANVGDHVFIEGGAVIGNNVTIKNGVLIWEGITIEDDVFVGPGVIFTNDRHPRSPRMPEASVRYATRAGWLVRSILRRGCSIGAGAVICPGVEVGRYAMVGAGAVVTQDVPPFALVVGNPARRRGDVCSCGQVLEGGFANSNCSACGESGSARANRLEAQ